MDSSLRTLEEALRGIVESMATDGYVMRIGSWDGRRLAIDIEAGPDACADCLVPPATMSLIVRGVIPDGVTVEDLVVNYPDGSASAGREPAAESRGTHRSETE
jgi:hypothetical protein